MSEKPKVSILTPTYNRPDFLELMIHNLKYQTYDKSKLEWVIIDDGNIPLSKSPLFKDLKKIISPIKLNYSYETHRRTIGEKRNLLVKKSSYKICINMDDDDIYFPQYIEHSVETLKSKKVGLVGSNCMLFVFPYRHWKTTAIRCKAKRQIHEATMCFYKKHFTSMGGFVKKNISEGTKMIDHNENNTELTDIAKCMMCVSHKKNTFSKDSFKDSSPIETKHPLILQKFEIIKNNLKITDKDMIRDKVKEISVDEVKEISVDEVKDGVQETTIEDILM